MNQNDNGFFAFSFQLKTLENIDPILATAWKLFCCEVHVQITYAMLIFSFLKGQCLCYLESRIETKVTWRSEQKTNVYQFNLNYSSLIEFAYKSTPYDLENTVSIDKIDKTCTKIGLNTQVAKTESRTDCLTLLVKITGHIVY